MKNDLTKFDTFKKSIMNNIFSKDCIKKFYYKVNNKKALDIEKLNEQICNVVIRCRDLYNLNGNSCKIKFTHSGDDYINKKFTIILSFHEVISIL